MNLLWFTWKDKKHPLAGGAETVNEELTKRLAKNGHKVILITAGFEGGAEEEVVDGYKIIRLGSRWTVYWRAYGYYKKNFQGWADLVIDEMNTIPFFVKFYSKSPLLSKEGPGVVGKETKNILFIHQLCREIWFYQMFFPLNLIGYLLEPLYLRLLNDRQVITVSRSTKKDLLKYGFKEENIKIISEGIELAPVEKLESYQVIKYKAPTILSLGSVRAMKRTDHIIKAFEIAKEKIFNLELIIAGGYDGKFGEKIYKMAKNSKFADSIKFLGKVNEREKVDLMRKSHILCATAIKEGWGLVVTEANSQGTPAIVYNTDGLRDSVRDNETGIICSENTPEDLAEKIEGLLKDEGKYDRMRFQGWQWSKEIDFERSYEEFEKIIKKYE